MKINFRIPDPQSYLQNDGVVTNFEEGLQFLISGYILKFDVYLDFCFCYVSDLHLTFTIYLSNYQRTFCLTETKFLNFFVL